MKNMLIKVFLGIRIKYIFGLQMAGIRDQDDMFGGGCKGYWNYVSINMC